MPRTKQLPMHLGLTCPFCLNQKISEHLEIDEKGRYVCENCGAEFAVIQQVSPTEFQFWQETVEPREYDITRVEKEVANIITKQVTPTTTPTYGSGEIWATFNEWKRWLSE